MKKQGAKFWLAVIGLTIGAALAGVLLFVFFGWAWYTLGFFGAFALLGGIAIAFAYVNDRRERKARAGLPT